MATLDPNQKCNIGFDSSACGIAQRFIILAGDIEKNPGPWSLCCLCKNIARHPKNLLNVRSATSAFTHHA